MSTEMTVEDLLKEDPRAFSRLHFGSMHIDCGDKKACVSMDRVVMYDGVEPGRSLRVTYEVAAYTFDKPFTYRTGLKYEMSRRIDDPHEAVELFNRLVRQYNSMPKGTPPAPRKEVPLAERLKAQEQCVDRELERMGAINCRCSLTWDE